MTQIAIVGTEGSGKTTLASVWAKYMQTRTSGNVFLAPTGWNTREYVNSVYTMLQGGGWWRSTEAGRQFELEWTLTVDKRKVLVKLIDSAGQDLRSLITGDAYKNTRNSSLRKLLDYIQKSDILVLVVNLRDFLDEPDGNRRWRNSAILQEVIGFSRHRHIAVVFTAWDCYHPVVEDEFGTFQNYLERALPELYISIRSGRSNGNIIDIFPVAAVDTEIETLDGTPFRVPRKNFTSYGIDTLSDWILKAEKEIADRKTKAIGAFVCAGCGAFIGTGLGWFFGGGVSAGIGCLIGVVIGLIGAVITIQHNT